MARRRFYKSKTSPEMGWIVGDSRVEVQMLDQADQYQTYVATLFDFSDIDPESLTGRIEKDKSDWFIKRVILDFYGTAAVVNTETTDVVRCFDVAMATVGIENAQEINTQNWGVFGAEFYNLVSRLFRTWSSVAYVPGVINLAAGAAATGIVVVDTPVVQGGWFMSAPYYGPSAVHADFEVSNAGLRNNQVCALAITLSDGPVPANNWDEEDTLYLRYKYRVLLQKRR